MGLANKISNSILFILIFIMFSSFASASLFGPDSPPPQVVNISGFCGVAGCNMTGDIFMNGNTIWNATLWYSTIYNATIINVTQINGSVDVDGNVTADNFIGNFYGNVSGENISDTYVSYTGAIRDVDLGSKELNASVLRAEFSTGGLLHLIRSTMSSVIDGNRLGQILFWGRENITGELNVGAHITAKGDGNWGTGLYHPTRLEFYTEDNTGGSGMAYPKLTINSDGEVWVTRDYHYLIFGSGKDITEYFDGSDRISMANYDNTKYYFYNYTDIIFDSSNVTADYYFGSGAYLSELNVTGNVSVDGDLDLSGYTLITSYIEGPGAGGMDLRGDPWYLGGTDFEIDQDLRVNNTVVENDLTVGNNLTVAGNISAQYYYGNGSLLTGLDNIYVPYIGATSDVNIGKHNYITNGSVQWLEQSGIQNLFYINPLTGDGFRMEYWYDFEVPNDDWLVFHKTDGNDIYPDGGIAFMMSNSSGYNDTVLKIYGNGLFDFDDNNLQTTGNITASNLCYSNGSGCINYSTPDLWANVSGTATYYNNVNITENLSVGGSGTFSGEIGNKSKLLGYSNVRIGAYSGALGWGTILFESNVPLGADTVWAIDNGGDNIRVYNPTSGYAKFRINDTTIIAGEVVAGREVDWDITGDTLARGDINQTTGNATINNIYGGMYYHNHTGTTLSFAGSSVFYNLFMTNASHLNGFIYQGGWGQVSNLTAQFSGLYQAVYMGIGSGVNNHIYLTSVFVNNVNMENCGNHKKMSAGGDVTTQSGICFIDLQVGDVVDIRTADYGDTGNGVYYGGNMNLIRVGN